jgi:hypothetical protein
MPNNLLTVFLIVLFMLSSSHALYGKKLPKKVWRLSLISSILTGLVLGVLTSDFPRSICLGIFYGCILLAFNFVARQAGKRHDV